MDELLLKMQDIIYKGEEEPFLSFCKEHEEYLLNLDPISYMSLEIEFYLRKEDKKKAIEVIDRHKEGKYISLECEEFLKETKEKLLKEQPSKKELSYDELKKMLLSGSEKKAYAALEMLSKRNVRLYLPVIKAFLKQNKSEQLFRLALMVLIDQKIDQEFKFIFNDKEVMLNPSKMVLPYDDERFLEFEKTLNKQDLPDIIKETIMMLAMQVFVNMYPDSLFDKFEPEVVNKFFYYVYLETFGSKKRIKDKIEAEKYREFKKICEDILNA